MTIATFFIYASSAYGFTVGYITCSALAMQAVEGVQSMCQSLPEGESCFDYEAFESEHVQFIENYLTKEFMSK
ncbi:MAG: hypothetical protein LUC41_07840 [Clostridiales bacterium]|nr:hypothetical protein [Clostridiales bacterium]